MSEEGGRKEAPDPDGEQEDEPLPGTDVSQQPKAEPVQEDPGAHHKRKIELSRLNFSYNLIGWCLFIMVVLLAFDHWMSPGKDAPSLDPLIETLKIMATTSLGFALAKKSDE